MKPYKAKMPEAYARIEWCKKTFGASQQNGEVRWWRTKGYVCFSKAEDYTLYLLRWA
jgi:hypothetical protein